jgi:hypothetical protein
MIVSAQVTPHATASRLPWSGAGAVLTGASVPMKKSASPTTTNAITKRSDRWLFSLRSHGPSRRT